MAGYDDQVAENPVFQATKDKLDSVVANVALVFNNSVSLEDKLDCVLSNVALVFIN